MMKKIFAGLLMICLVTALSPEKARAAGDKVLETVFKDAYFGAAIGGLLGAAFMVFTDRPADHFNYIAYGLAGGVIGGTVYGMTMEAKSFAEVEGGGLTVAIPTPSVQISYLGYQKSVSAVWPVLRYKF